MDHLTPARRSKNMAAIKGRDTHPEMIVRRLVHGLGYRYRLHRRDLPGKPDLIFTSLQAVIFIHGCFWHQHDSSGCKARPPKSNSEYWLPKLQKNVERDQRNLDKLKMLGWRILVIWECETRDTEELKEKVISFLS
ncbi:MAG TPA: DNA mismatch endonuclease Vsr [Rhodospirillales bacterium]|nr:DNA mismatch endonuclease Vsr [Rhodospirillales bacterium]